MLLIRQFLKNSSWSLEEYEFKNVISCSASLPPFYTCVCVRVCLYMSIYVTCCPGLIGDSVIPWVLMTGRIWLPITVAMIWPWALVRSWGVIGCTCSAGLPPPDWLEGPAELGISGIVPIIYKGGKRGDKISWVVLKSRKSGEAKRYWRYQL